MVLQDSVEASSDMRDAGDVCLDEVWEDGMLSVSAWLGPCSQSISTSCSSGEGGGGVASHGGGMWMPPPADSPRLGATHQCASRLPQCTQSLPGVRSGIRMTTQGKCRDDS